MIKVKGDGQPPLAEGVHALGFSQELAACGNKQMLAVLGVHIVTYHGDHRAAEIAVEAIDQHALQQRALENGVAFAVGQIGIGRGRFGRGLRPCRGTAPRQWRHGPRHAGNCDPGSTVAASP